MTCLVVYYQTTEEYSNEQCTYSHASQTDKVRQFSPKSVDCEHGHASDDQVDRASDSNHVLGEVGVTVHFVLRQGGIENGGGEVVDGVDARELLRHSQYTRDDKWSTQIATKNTEWAISVGLRILTCND